MQDGILNLERSLEIGKQLENKIYSVKSLIDIAEYYRVEDRRQESVLTLE